jgi:hypothetical protein
MRARSVLLVVAVVLLAGCQPGPVEETPTPDPAAIPSGSPQAIGATATGPIVELGSGVLSGLGWRYLVYPSDLGWCTQLDTAAATQTDCRGVDPDEGNAFGTVNRNGRVVHGIATPDATTVWLVVGNTPTIPAFLMPLSEAGVEGGVAFVGIAPTGTEVTHVMAVKFNGEVLGTLELP